MATTPVSPKVTSAAAVGSIVGLFLSFANAATPETFAALGTWSYPAFLALSLGAAVLAAWWKTDPLRSGTTPPDTTAAPAPAADSVVVNAPATAAEPAAPTTFTATAAKIDALPDAPAVAPILPN